MSNGYLDNWNEIATRIKNKVGWCCERCHRHHDPAQGFTLTVHHLDSNKANNEGWNLAALCQRCHLHLQWLSIIALFHQLELFEPFEQRWLQPHKEGFEKWIQTHIPGK